MLSKNTRVAVVGIIAALGSAFAQQAAPATEVQQLPVSFQELANKKCHPDGTYKLEDENSVIPPCIAEQLIFTECEGRAGFINAEGVRLPPGSQNMDIYRQCLLGKGSTLEADRDGCLACKKSNEILSGEEADFWKTIYSEAASKLGESNDTKTLPELHEELRLQRTEFPQPLQENKNVTVPLEEYYPDPPKPQRVGESEAVEEREEEQDTDKEEGQGPVKRQVTVQAGISVFATASFNCQRPGVGSFTPAMVPQSPEGKASSSVSSMSSTVPTTLIKTVPSTVPDTNLTGSTNVASSNGTTVSNGTTITNSTRVPSSSGTVNGTQVTNGTSPQSTSPPGELDMTFIFVMVFTPSQHVMKRQQDGSYVYVLVFGKPAPIADSPETPQQPLGSREEGEKRGLPDISKCGECADKQVTLPGIVKADAAQAKTEQADEASRQVLEKVESTAKQSGEKQTQNTVFLVNIGITAVTTTGEPEGETPSKPAGAPAGTDTPRAGVKDVAKGLDTAAASPDQAPVSPGVPAANSGSQPPRSNGAASGTPQAAPTSEDWC